MILRDCAIIVLLWIVLGTPTHLAFEQVGAPCPASDPCPDQSRPWMRGTVEKFCGRAQHLALLREANPGKTIDACACKHSCDPKSEHAALTDSRGWDALCGARCNPKNCACPNPCDDGDR